MRVRMVWEQCTEFESGTVPQPRDMYWVECPAESVDDRVMPYLSPRGREQAKLPLRPEQSDADLMARYGNRTGCRYFLVAKDLSVVVPMLWFYPQSHTIHGCQPLRMIPEFHIERLEELPAMAETVR